jgi:hypothetical protein
LANIEILQGNMVSLQHEIAQYTNDSKNKDFMLQTREKECSERIEHNRIEKEKLTAELEIANKKYNEMKGRLENSFENLEKSMIFYEDENNKVKKELTELTPGYEELCKIFQETCTDYEAIKKDVIDIKGRKLNLELTITGLKKKTDEQEQSRVKK